MLDWLSSTGLEIVVVILSAWLASKSAVIVIRKLVEKLLKSDKLAPKDETAKRLETITRVFTSTVKLVIWVVASVIILALLGIDLGPIIAGAGLAGVAISFGAQDTISDFVSGFYIIIENHYRVGDVVSINGVSGKVQKITMRITVLRDLDGEVHYVRNGEINMSTNKTMTFSRVNMDIGVSYADDIDKVERVINSVGHELAEDEKWHELIIEEPRFIRVQNFGDSAIEVKIMGKTKPGKHWKVAGELRRRLKKAFDKEGIEIPFPQSVIHQGKKSPS